MKKYILYPLFYLFPIIGISQNGQIISINTNPANPTTNDFVKVYVELMFTSGGCDVDNKSHSTNGFSTTASALHCVGMLTVICPITDTFDLGYLPAGNHQFDFTLSSGSGGPGCSPGIVPDDSDTYNFTVTSGLGIENPTDNSSVIFYPNPMNDFAILKINGNVESENLCLEISDAAGRLVVTKESVSSNEILIDNKNLESGIYFYRLLDNGNLLAVDKFVVE